MSWREWLRRNANRAGLLGLAAVSSFNTAAAEHQVQEKTQRAKDLSEQHVAPPRAPSAPQQHAWSAPANEELTQAYAEQKKALDTLNRTVDRERDVLKAVADKLPEQLEPKVRHPGRRRRD
jgi:hypothetical protein